MRAKENQEPWLHFRDKLDDYEEVLPQASWEQLEARLPQAVLRPKQQGREQTLKRWLGLTAAIAVTVFSLYFLTKNMKEESALHGSMNTSMVALADQSSLSLPINVTNLFCEGPACYYLDHNMVGNARIYAVSEDGIALFTAKRDGFELEGQKGIDSALQASLLKTLNDHRQVFMQSLSDIFRHRVEVK